MSVEYLPSVSLHQQAGGMTPQAFAELQGISLQMVCYYLKRGRIVGAQRDARSKRWTIYPPAKLRDLDGDSMSRSKASARGAAASQGSAEPLPACGKTPVAGASHANDTGEFSTCTRPAVPVSVFASPEIKSICRALHEAAVRQFCAGMLYLRLDVHEFALLYAALDHERTRLRKLVGKGVVPVGKLRASDSVWCKLQAMSREGRLL